MSKNILLISSPGGHFVQLSLLAEMLGDFNVTVVGTYEHKPSFIIADDYLTISDFSRDSAFKLPLVFLQCMKILKRKKPDLVVTTGAAPGLAMLILCKLFFINAIWIDSVANSQKLSLSGRIAAFLNISVLSQWEDVAKDSKAEYKGRVI